MAIKEEVKGNVIDALKERERATLFFHGCNMQGVMGSGVAKQVCDTWPRVFRIYENILKSRISTDLGDVIFSPVQSYEDQKESRLPMLIVANGLTQRDFGTDKTHARAEAIKQAIGRIEEVYPPEGPAGKGIPDLDFVAVRVGCGLGGLDWDDVKPIFGESSIDWTIYYL